MESALINWQFKWDSSLTRCSAAHKSGRLCAVYLGRLAEATPDDHFCWVGDVIGGDSDEWSVQGSLEPSWSTWDTLSKTREASSRRDFQLRTESATFQPKKHGQKTKRINWENRGAEKPRTRTKTKTKTKNHNKRTIKASASKWPIELSPIGSKWERDERHRR